MLRLWYPQLDVYDTIRRIYLLLSHFENAPGVERLTIADFYLANPSLLHKTSMPMDTRAAFRHLGIEKPEKSFVKLPAPAILFHKMEPTQKQAIAELSGKDLISNSTLQKGKFELTPEGKKLFIDSTISTANELALCKFLTSTFLVNEEIGNKKLREQTGLRRIS
jgi:hypothetical protein